MSEPVIKKQKSADIIKCILCHINPMVPMDTGTIRDLCCNMCKLFCEPIPTLNYTK